jgi:hypothetical protein
MPYDDIDPTDLARMQAAVDFNRYDDGASQLQRSPFMQQVGLFGKAKPKPVVTPNLSRRTMGLNIPTQMPDQLPAVIDPLAKLPPGGPIAAQPSALPQAPAVKLYRAGDLSDPVGRGVFLSDNKKTATQYGTDVKEYSIAPDTKLYNASNRWDLIKELDTKWDKQKAYDRYVKQGVQGNITPEMKLQSDAEQRIRAALAKQGYDGVRYNDNSGTDQVGEFQIFNPQKLITGSTEPVNPLAALAKMPMSRRKFMEIPANAAVSHIGKQAVGTIAPKAIPEVVPEVIPEIASEVISNVAPAISPTIPLIDKFFRENVLDSVIEQMQQGDWGQSPAYEFYDEVRHHLKGNIPDKDLATLDKYSTYLLDSYEKIFEGADPTKKHYNTVKKFGDLFGKYLDYIPMEDVIGGTEFTVTEDEPAYMKSMLEDFDFTEGQINEYLQHFFGDDLKRYEGFGED